jgi:hypothetical protein
MDGLDAAPTYSAEAADGTPFDRLSVNQQHGIAMKMRFITTALFYGLFSFQAFPHGAESRDHILVDSSKSFRGETIHFGSEAPDVVEGQHRLVSGTAEPDRSGLDEAAKRFTMAQQTYGLHSRGDWRIKIDELMPDLYPPLAQAPLTREQVKKELADAIRRGDLYHGSTGLKLNQVYPWRYRSDSIQDPVKDATTPREHLDPPPTASPEPRTPTATQGPH